ncbi:hypothetical protein [Winogradskyella alexanderae]|uniref:Uncharacterized protein n=1 Tax=Winogradskyella alexanderae TaxID=2877123 RepID=A0ABS7XPE7_9FLAO|nr:hypothetical protein [Winogradskyella alexanderae]MCA0131655.1 hypothetical protein [Winogradskyella alexanderae]
MIKTFLTSIFFVFLLFSYGQQTNKFLGFIKIQDTLVITYKLEFSENEGKISGYSLTDFGGEHETKSKIEGTYDHNKNMLAFKESELIYTKSTFSEADFCNVHLEPTKFKIGGNKLMGSFKGLFNDGTECISGEIAMNSIERIDKRVTKFTKRLEKSNRVPDSIKQKLKNTKLLDTINLNVLKKNETTSVLTKANKVKFFVYDGGQIDDDVITIKKNGKTILSNYRISADKKILEVDMDAKQVQLTIHSISEGSIGSNTAIIEIIDGVNTIKTMTNLKKGDITRIDLIKK